MPSSFTWIDHSERERRHMLDVLSLFREQGTVDELGIGVIRDAIGDLLFPGTSYVHTRIKYFLLVPWIYRDLEQRQTPSAEIARRARQAEIRLIDVLCKADDSDGVIGRRARASLQRLPSSVYWSGLGRLGIRRFDGSQDAYHRNVDTLYLQRRQARWADDGEMLEGPAESWRAGLPDPPETFPGEATLALTASEAAFLRERILTDAGGSLFAELLRHDVDVGEADYPWLVPHGSWRTPTLADQVAHAELFSLTLHGAALLYNYLLSNLTSQADYVDHYTAELTAWTEEMARSRDRLRAWDLDRFWSYVWEGGGRVGERTKAFVAEWIRLAVEQGGADRVMTDDALRTLIARRERSLKGVLARLDSARARERYTGAAGASRLNYRWPVVQQFFADLNAGRDTA
jgi:hypothetical protein